MTRKLLMTLVLLAAACGEEHEDEACEHLQTGAQKPIAASATPTSTPAVAEHDRWVVTFPSGGRGFLSFAASGAGKYDLLLSEAVTVIARDAAGATAPQTAASDVDCSAARTRLQLTLAVGTHTLELGPTAFPSVQMVVEKNAH